MQRQARLVRLCSVLALTVSAVLPAGLAKAAQAPPCHPANSEDISGRGDIVNLPADLKEVDPPVPASAGRDADDR